MLLIYNVLKIARVTGDFNSFSEALAIFKTQTSYSNSISIPHYLNLMFKIPELSSYIFIYVFFKKIYSSSNKNIFYAIYSNLYYLLVPFLYIIKELLSSSRITILQLTFASITFGFFIWYQTNNWKKNINYKFIIAFLITGLIGLSGFYFSASLIGRSNTKNIIEYITMYSGGSIECLNQYIQYPNPVDESTIIGNETFYPLIRSLDKYGITNCDIDSKQTAHLSFRYYNDTMIGNVYTAYRRWHHDFGYIGLIILNAVMSLIINYCYYSFKYKFNQSKWEFLFILYGYISYSIFLHPIDSYFYTTIFQITFLTNIILFLMLYILILKLNFDFNNRQVYYDNTKINKELLRNFKRFWGNRK